MLLGRASQARSPAAVGSSLRPALPGSSALRAAPARHGASVRRAQRIITAETQIGTKGTRGQRLDPALLAAGRQLGSGSFGECYKGTLATADGGEVEVVLKRVKARVEGAQEMHEAEHLLNVLASKNAGDAVAPFLGYALVEDPVGRLTRGLWLVWEYEGDKTLAYYLKRRDCEKALAADLGVDEAAAVPTVMKQIFECLVALHNVGIVHRDIKPANIVFHESERRFKLIDLGAAADLRTGTNYKPGETILDPCYCPPEEYVLPTDAPHLAEKGAIGLAMSSLLWTQHRPDCFDTYSAGIVLMQLGLPYLRTTSSLRTFNGALARCNYDLEEWRIKSALPARQTALLDANNGTGWDLAASLLRPREITTDDTGGVKFVNTGKAPRLGAAAAIKHPFIAAVATRRQQAGAAAAAPAASSGRSGSGAQSAKPAAAASNKSGSGKGGSGKSAASSSSSASTGSGGGSITSLWGKLKGKLFDLEARVFQEATATEVQTAKVQELRSAVAAGKASEDDLQREESVLAGMQRSLTTSVKEMNTVYGAAKGFLSSVLGGSGSAKGRSAGKAAALPAPKAAATPAAAEPDKRMPKWAAREVPLKDVPGASYQVQQQQQAAAPAPAPAAAKQVDAEVVGTSAGAAAAAAVTGAMGGFFTGLSNLAASMSEQAKRNAEQAAAEAALKKQAASLYLEALQAMQLTSLSTWEEVSPVVPEQAEFAVLSDRRREQIFKAYSEALRRAEQAKRTRAQAGFQMLMVSAGVGPDTTYADFEAENGSDERFTALDSEVERVDAFDAFTAKLRAAQEAAQRREAAQAEAAAAAAARLAARAAEDRAAEVRVATQRAAERAAAEAAEAAYRQLMQEHNDLIASGAGYPQLKLKMWTDPRFDAVPEARRKQLYSDYYAILEEAGMLVPAGGGAAAAVAAAPAGGDGGDAQPAAAAAGVAVEEAALLAGAPPGASKEQLDWLRQEQARLKEEYAKMEAKLREMEQKLKQGGVAPAGPSTADLVAAQLEGMPTVPSVIEKEDGSVTFRLSDSVPSAAEFNKTVAAAAGAAGEPVVEVNGSHSAK